VGIVARVPLASGVLSGKYAKNTSFGEDDHRNFNKDGEAFNVGETFAGVPFEKGIEFAKRIDAYRPEGMSLAQMALRWILDFEAVAVVIPGATTPEQAKSVGYRSPPSVRKVDVHEDDVNRPLPGLHEPLSLVRPPRLEHPEAVVLEQRTQGPPEVDVVVDDEYGERFGVRIVHDSLTLGTT